MAAGAHRSKVQALMYDEPDSGYCRIEQNSFYRDRTGPGKAWKVIEAIFRFSRPGKVLKILCFLERAWKGIENISAVLYQACDKWLHRPLLLAACAAGQELMYVRGLCVIFDLAPIV